MSGPAQLQGRAAGEPDPHQGDRRTADDRGPDRESGAGGAARGQADRDGHGDGRGRDDGRGEGNAGSSGGGDEISPWEWVTAITGLLLVLGAIGVMLWEGVARDDLPPSFEMRVDSTFTRPDGFHVLFRAHNGGDITAAEVRVRALLMRGDSAVMQEDVTFDYLPPRSTRRGAVIFPSRPPQTTIELRPLGYHQP